MKKIFAILVASLLAAGMFVSCKMPNQYNEPKIVYKEIYKEIYKEDFDMLNQISHNLGRYISIDLFASNIQDDSNSKKWILTYNKESERYAVWFPENNLKHLEDFVKTKKMQKIEKMSDVAEFAVYLCGKYEAEPFYKTEKLGTTIVSATVMFDYNNFREEGAKLKIKNDHKDLLKEGR